MANEEIIKFKSTIHTIRFKAEQANNQGKRFYVFTILKEQIDNPIVLDKVKKYVHGIRNNHLVIVTVNTSDLVEAKQTVELSIKKSDIDKIVYNSQYQNYSIPASNLTALEEITVNGFVDFLHTNYSGVGPTMAKKILDNLLKRKVTEEELLNKFKDLIINNDSELKNILKKKFDSLKKVIEESLNEEKNSVSLNEPEKIFCSNYKIGQNFLLRLKKQLIKSYNHKNKTRLNDISILKYLKKTPYLLALDDQIKGFGFKSIDNKVFQFMGTEFQKDSSFKLQRFIGYLQYVLLKAEESGHLYLNYEQIYKEFKEYNLKEENIDFHFDIDEDLFFFKERIHFYIDTLRKEDTTLNPYFMNDRLLSTLQNFYLEKKLAKLLVQINSIPLKPLGEKANKILIDLEKEKKLTLSEEQKEAVFNAINNRISIITGGPGTGKTTISQMVVGILSKLGKTIKVLAPTGTASKRISTVIGREAMTIHRGLDFKGYFQRNQKNPLEEEVIIIDESSMIDTKLASSLVKASINSQIIFIGDINQLPSVGAGDFLRDIIDSGAFNVSHLTKIFRQAQGNPIITFSYKVNEGASIDEFTQWFTQKEDMHSKMSILSKPIYKNKIDGEKNPEAMKSMIEDTQKIGFRQYILNRDLMASQILVTNNKSNNSINSYLQTALNGEGEIIPDTDLKVGDKIIQTKNNYQLQIFNGTIGIIEGYNKFSDVLSLRVGDERIEMDRLIAKKELQLCYSMTIHKSQGQEFKYVVMLLNDFMLNNREIIYTGATRAKEHLKVITNTLLLRMGLQASNKSGHKNFRNTRLVEFIQEEVKELKTLRQTQK